MREWLRKDGRYIGLCIAAVLAGGLAGFLLVMALEPLIERAADAFSGAPAQQEQPVTTDPPADSTRYVRPQPQKDWLAESTYAVAADGPTVYLGDGASLEIVDFTRPETPARMGGVALPATPEDIVLSGDYAYIALSDSTAGGKTGGETDGVFGVLAVDVSDPTAPRVVGAFDTEGATEELAVEGDYVYVANGEHGLRVLDVSDPTRMREVGSYVSANPDDETVGVAVASGYVYLAVRKVGLRTLDVSDPRNPLLRSTYDLSRAAKEHYRPEAM